MLDNAFTAILEFDVNEGEYKVMGRAPYGSPRFLDEIWKVVQQSYDGAFWLDPQYFAFHYSTKKSYTTKLIDLFGEPRDPKVPFFTENSDYPAYYGDRPPNFAEMCQYHQHYAAIAARIQLATEELMLQPTRYLRRQTP